MRETTRRGNVRAGFRKHESKFVAAITRGGIDGARMAAKNLRKANDGAASGEMAVVIVDGLETIHIQKHDAERTLRAARTVQFRFQHADEPAIVGEAGERIADGHRANLVKEARLIEQRAGKHDDVTGGLAHLRKEERAIEEMARKGRGDVANHVERGHDEERIVVQARGGLIVLAALETLSETNGGEQEQRARKQIPGTRNKAGCVSQEAQKARREKLRL